MGSHVNGARMLAGQQGLRWTGWGGSVRPQLDGAWVLVGQRWVLSSHKRTTPGDVGTGRLHECWGGWGSVPPLNLAVDLKLLYKMVLSTNRQDTCIINNIVGNKKTY